MTQTILKCNEIPAVKTYPVSDLLTAESIAQLCAYVDAGHPIAKIDGNQVILLRRRNEVFTYDVWLKRSNDEGFFGEQVVDDAYLIKYIKLAPLAYRNGRPLHVGDDIEIFRSWLNEAGEWTKCKATAQHSVILSHATEAHEWRFADEVTV